MSRLRRRKHHDSDDPDAIMCPVPGCDCRRICSERDGNGWSTCGVLCGAHNPITRISDRGIHRRWREMREQVMAERRLAPHSRTLKAGRQRPRPHLERGEGARAAEAAA